MTLERSAPRPLAGSRCQVPGRVFPDPSWALGNRMGRKNVEQELKGNSASTVLKGQHPPQNNSPKETEQDEKHCERCPIPTVPSQPQSSHTIQGQSYLMVQKGAFQLPHCDLETMREKVCSKKAQLADSLC